MIQKTDDSIIGGILIVGGATGMTFQSFIDSMELAMVFATITGNLILVISGIILMYPRLGLKESNAVRMMKNDYTSRHP